MTCRPWSLARGIRRCLTSDVSSRAAGPASVLPSGWRYLRDSLLAYQSLDGQWFLGGAKSACLWETQLSFSLALHWPGIRYAIAVRPWVTRVQHVLVYAGDPCAAADLGSNSAELTDVCSAQDLAVKFRTDD